MNRNHVFHKKPKILRTHLEPRFAAKCSIREAHREVCWMIRTNQLPTNVVVTGGLIYNREPQSNNTLVTVASDRNSGTVGVSEARPVEVQNEEKELRVDAVKRRTIMDNERKQGVEKYKNEGIHEIQITKIRDSYENLTMKLFKTLDRDTGRLIRTQEDLLNILFHRRHSQKCYQASKNYQFQLEKLKFTVGYTDVKLEIAMKDSPEVTTLEYWCQGQDRCAVVYGATRFYLDKSCDEVSAVDLYFLLKHPLLRLPELEFAIEPYDLEYDHFPDISAIAIVGLLLMNKRSCQTHVKKLGYMFTRESMFMDKLSTFSLDTSVLAQMLIHLPSRYLHELSLRVWNDSELIAGDRELELIVSDLVERNKVMELQLDGLVLSRSAWKHAKVLNVEDRLMAKDWTKFLHFETVCVLNMDAKRILHAKNIFQQKDMLPGNGFTIQVRDDMNLLEIQNYLIAERINVRREENELSVSCLTNDDKKWIFFKIDNRKIVVTHRKKRRGEVEVYN